MNFNIINIFKNKGLDLIGLFPPGQEPLSVNSLTLNFKGELQKYEKGFLDDYFIKSLSGSL